MDNRPPLLNWRLRLIWLRSLLVLVITLALIVLQRFGHTGYQLTELGWLGALLLPNLVTLLTRKVHGLRHSQLLTLELAMDVVLFAGLIQGFGGAGNPLSFYLLVPALMASLTLPMTGGLLVALLALGGYMVSLSWYQMPAMNSPLHALSHQLSGLHSAGMAAVFIALLVMLSLLGQVIQRLMRQQQRQQEQALDLAGRREHMYQVAATLADQAHELNTPLGTLVMLADNLIHAPEMPDSLRPEVEQMDHLARNVASRLKQGTDAQLESGLPLSVLIQQLQQHLRHLAPTLNVTHALETDPQVADSQSWFRVLCNLGYNAMDAGATRLAITVSNHAPLYRLQLSDDGPAHPDSEREGLGMGLTLVHSSLAQIGAELEMDFGHSWTQARIHWPQTDSPGAAS